MMKVVSFKNWDGDELGRLEMHVQMTTIYAHFLFQSTALEQNWLQTEIFEIHLTRNITDDELDTLIKNKGQKTFSNLLCHTQALERTVILVRKASTKVCGLEKQDGYIRTQIVSRKLLPVLTQNVNSKRK